MAPLAVSPRLPGLHGRGAAGDLPRIRLGPTGRFETLCRAQRALTDEAMIVSGLYPQLPPAESYPRERNRQSPESKGWYGTNVLCGRR